MGGMSRGRGERWGKKNEGGEGARDDEDGA